MILVYVFTISNKDGYNIGFAIDLEREVDYNLRERDFTKMIYLPFAVRFYTAPGT